GGSTLRRAGDVLPLRSLARTLGLAETREERWGLIIEVGGHAFVFAVPALVGEFDLLRRPLDALAGSSDCLSASAILDDGRLVLLLTPSGLLRLSSGAALRPAAAARTSRVLVVDDSAVVRELVGGILKASGYQVGLACDGRAA